MENTHTLRKPYRAWFTIKVEQFRRYIWACDKRCSHLTRVCLYTIYFVLLHLQLYETQVASIQYALMSS